jgi:hypothetical protein
MLKDTPSSALLGNRKTEEFARVSFLYPILNPLLLITYSSDSKLAL